jgi:choloylglycine hydrolase
MTTVMVVWALCSATPAARACSTFLLRGEDGLFLGRNDDVLVKEQVPGILVVNQRGVTKVAFPIEVGQTVAFSWTSKYGSVTFSYVGKDFPDGGMNEAGLVVEEMSLDGTRPPKIDGATLLMQPQWIQYQLDRHATVAEVIASLKTLTPVVGGWHYLVADATGRAAVIEFIDGETIVYLSRELNPAVLTNITYEDSLENLVRFVGFGGEDPIPSALTAPEGRDLEQYVGFGGSKPIPEGVYSQNRFARGASLLAAYERDPTGRDVEFAFEVLQSMSFGIGTKRSIVHDINGRKIYFRTDRHREIRQVSLGDLDFSADRASLCVDVNQRLSGSVVPHLKVWQPEDDRPMIEFLLALVESNPESKTVTMSYATDHLVESSETLLEFNRRLRESLRSPEERGSE